MRFWCEHCKMAVDGEHHITSEYHSEIGEEEEISYLTCPECGEEVYKTPGMCVMCGEEIDPDEELCDFCRSDIAGAIRSIAQANDLSEERVKDGIAEYLNVEGY